MWAGHKEGQASDLVRALREAVAAAVADPAWGELADDERFRKLATSAAALTSGGLDTLRRFGAREYPAFLVRPRRVDAGAALNRFRGLKLSD